MGGGSALSLVAAAVCLSLAVLAPAVSGELVLSYHRLLELFMRNLFSLIETLACFRCLVRYAVLGL